jgi:pimeloyl-ACP methyl ester carboxylesterase
LIVAERLATLFCAAALGVAVVIPSAATGSPAGPLDLTGEINGAPFRIIVPEAWNGKLLVFAHGYNDKADHPGEIDNRDVFQGGTEAARTTLLAQRWAVAGTAYKDNGWAVKEALDDLVALTSHFKDNVGKPEHTYLMGFSMGSVPTLKLAEQNGGAFDGYIAACSIGAGTPRGADWILTTMLAYDVTFGEPASWGTPGNVRDDIDFETEVAPVLVPQLFNFAKFEFIRLVAGTPGQGLPLGGLFPTWALQDFFFATEAGGELERRAGGPVVQNLTHTYGLTTAEKEYLVSLGLDSEPLLNAMNGRRTISAPPASRNYVERYARFDGTIKKPVIALHTKLDGLTPVSHVSAYQDTVDGAGTSDLLFRAFTTGVGHCQFTTEQLVTTANALDAWVKDGIRPTNAAFPASQGFDQGFDPPNWLQP